MANRIVDDRGYAGSERNRVLDPRLVMWAREKYALREISAVGLARQLGMGVESVRRMLRGETYANVGQALPREHLVEESLRVDDGGALERLLERQRELDEKPAEVELPSEEERGWEAAVDLFLNDRKER